MTKLPEHSVSAEETIVAGDNVVAAFADKFEEAKKILEQDFEGSCWRDHTDLSPVTPDDEVWVSLASGNRTKCLAAHFVEVVFSAADGEIASDGTFIGHGIAVTRVVPVNAAARALCDGASLFDLDEQYLRHEEGALVAWLDNGLTELALHYSALRISHELVPECGADWMFLCVSGEVDLPALDGVFVSYLFSIEESQQLVFAMERFPEISDAEYSEMFPHDEMIRGFAERQLRPLLPTEHKEVLRLYLEACALPSVGFQILGFARVVEYVAAKLEQMLGSETDRVVAEIADAGIRTRLEELIRKQKRKRTPDVELVAQAVDTICDPLPLVALAPPALAKLGALTALNFAKERAAALDQLSELLSATRNEIAHAKATYTHRGIECPVDQYPQFAALMRALAQQAIQWLVVRDPKRSSGPS